MAASIGCKAFMACRQTAAPARRPMRVSAARPAALQTAFLRPACSLNSVCSSFAGMRLSSSPRLELATPSRRGLSIVAMGGNSIGNTKGGTRRARTRTSGFRARRLTVGGRHVLKNRRKKGRKVLAVGSYRK